MAAAGGNAGGLKKAARNLSVPANLSQLPNKSQDLPGETKTRHCVHFKLSMKSCLAGVLSGPAVSSRNARGTKNFPHS